MNRPLPRRPRVTPTGPEQAALLKAAGRRNRAAFAQARQAWVAALGEGTVLAWAVEKLSPWAVRELLGLGERVTPLVVITALDGLDQALAAQSAVARAMWEAEALANWRLLLPAVEASLELRRVAIDCFLRRHIPSLVATKSQLSWEPLEMDRVFQKDLLVALREAPLPEGLALLIVGLGKDEPPAPCYLAPLQIAWEQGRPDLCLGLLQQGLSVQATYPDSLWPTWTLEQAVLDPREWVMALTGEAAERAFQAFNAYDSGFTASHDPVLDRLTKVVREKRLDQSLPAAAPLARSPRF